MDNIEDLRRKFSNTYATVEGHGPCLIIDFEMPEENVSVVHLTPKSLKTITVPLKGLKWDSTQFPDSVVNYRDGVAVIHNRADRQWKNGLSRSSHQIAPLTKSYIEAVYYSGKLPSAVKNLASLPSYNLEWTPKDVLDLFDTSYYSLEEAIEKVFSGQRLGAAISPFYSIYPSFLSANGVLIIRKKNVIADLNLPAGECRMISSAFKQEMLDLFQQENMYVRVSG